VEVERGRQTDGLSHGRFGEFPNSALVRACWFFWKRADEWMRMSRIWMRRTPVGQHMENQITAYTKRQRNVSVHNSTWTVYEFDLQEIN
jgi:hypothetical protein